MAIFVVTLVLTTSVIGGIFITRARDAQAAVSNTVNFQARLMTSSGAIVPDGYYHVEFKLYTAATSTGTPDQGACTASGSADAACEWTETRTGANTVRVANGYLTVNLGSVNPFPSSINWDQEHWLSMRIGGMGGTPTWEPTEMNPRLKLTAVPYAFTAGKLVGKNGTGSTTLDVGTTNNTNLIHLPDESGTICLQNSANCGFVTSTDLSNSAILLQSSSPGTAQVGSFNIDGIGIVGTKIVTPEIDTASAVPLGIGATASIINLSTNTHVLGDVDVDGVYKVDGTSGATLTCTSGDFVRNAVINGGIITGGDCAAGGSVGSYVSLQASTPGTQETGHINISGKGIFGTSVVTPTVDTASSVPLEIGATSSRINLNKSTYVTGNLSITGSYLINGTQITSAALSNDANLAKLNATQTFSGNNTFTGSTTLFKNTTNSTTAFQVQNTAGTVIFNVDTTNNKVGIGTTGVPNYALDVNSGDIRTSGIYRVGAGSTAGMTLSCGVGNTISQPSVIGGIMTAGSCYNMVTAGIGSFVQLQAGLGTPETGSSNITGTGTFGTKLVAPDLDTASAITLTIGNTATDIALKKNTSVTGNMNITGQYQVNGSQIASANLADNSNLAHLNAYNTFRNTTDSATSFRIQNSAGTSTLFNADTLNNTITLRAAGDVRTISAWYTADFSTGWDWSMAEGWTSPSANSVTIGGSNTQPNPWITEMAGHWAVIGNAYQVTYTVSGAACTSTVAIVFGHNGVVWRPLCNGTYTFTGVATTTYGLIIQAPNGATGTISNVQVKNVTGTGAPVLVLQHSSGNANLEIRTTGSSTSGNIYMGLSAGQYITSGVQNTAVGSYAMQNAVTNSQSTAFGYSALNANQSGSFNTAIGTSALRVGISGSYNTAVGYNSLYSATGSNNVAVGDNTAVSTTTGSRNAVLGSYALQTNVTGNDNTAVGAFALNTNKGANNTALGSDALRQNDGAGNTAIGYRAGYATTTGSSNTFVGIGAGNNDQTAAFTTVASLQRATAIGAYAQVQVSDAIVLGSVDYGAKVGIGITTPTNTLSVSPLDYKVGSATRTNGSPSVVGTGTTWTAAMVGDLIVFADGFNSRVTAVADATHLTMANNATVSDGTSVAYRLHKPGLNVTTTGKVGVNIANPAYDLDVRGDINLTGTMRLGGSAALTMATACTGSQALIGAGFTSGLAMQGSCYELSSIGAGSFVRLQGGTPTVDTGSMYISGSAQIDTKVLTPLLDTATATNMGIGGNATVVNFNSNAAFAKNVLIKPTSDSTTAFRIQKAATTNDVLAVDTVNSTVTVRAGSDTLTLGPELYSGDFSSGWAGSPSWDITTDTSRATHQYGNTVTLLNTALSIQSGKSYQVKFRVASSCLTGHVQVSIGGSSRTITGCSGQGDVYTFIFNTTSTGQLGFSPTSDWGGNISQISVKEITGIINPVLAVDNSTGTRVIEMRATGSATNIFLGKYSGQANLTGTDNLSLGSSSLMNNITGSNNTALGSNALLNNTTGYNNVAIGSSSLAYSAVSYNNTAIGAYALQNNLVSSNNLAIGSYSLGSNTYGARNAALGANSLYTNTTGSDNTAIGSDSLHDNTTGNNNTAIGANALDNNTTGNYSVAIGKGSLFSSNGSANVAVGYSSQYNTTSGHGNVSLGFYAVNGNTTGSYNIGIGEHALNSNTTGSFNSALGYQAGYQDTNTRFQTLANLQRATAIGAYAQVQANDSIVLGSVDNLTKVGIGITVPSNMLSVSPLDYQTGTVTRTNGSATLVGTGTAWTSAMVGDIIVFADGTTNTVSAFTDATHITMGTTYTGTTDAAPVYYRFHKQGFNVTTAGDSYTRGSSTTAFQIQDSSGAALMRADTTSGTLNVTSTVPNRVFVTELAAAPFTTGWTATGWDITTDPNNADHTAANTNVLTNTSATVTVGEKYEVNFWAQDNGGTGRMIIAMGGVTMYDTTTSPYYLYGWQTYYVTATSTAKLSFTPTSDWIGMVSAVTIKRISGVNNAALTVKNSTGTGVIDIRANTDPGSLYIGANAGKDNVDGVNNTTVGANALQLNISGSDNIAFGTNTLAAATYAYRSIAIGSGALKDVVSSYENIAIGYNALQSSVGGYNIALGNSALGQNSDGTSNIAIGHSTLAVNSSGYGNVGVGDSALFRNTSGIGNAALGRSALYSTETGEFNVGVGENAGSNNSSGNYNLFLGYNAGSSEDNYNVSGPYFGSGSNLQNATAIGAFAQVQADDSIVLGSVNRGTKVGIGITIPSNMFSVSPVRYQVGSVTRTNGSATLIGDGADGQNWITGGVQPGDTIIFSDGTSNKVLSVGGATTLTMATTYTGTTDSWAQAYRIHRGGFNVTQGGDAFIQNTSAQAFAVQTSAGSNVFTVDTANGIVRMGDATNNVTFDLDGSASSFTLNGNARHKRSIILTPEYAGAVLAPSGSNNMGTMTSGIEASYSFYRWTTTQATAQSYDVVVRAPLPSDFAGWDTTSISIGCKLNDVANSSMQYQITRTDGVQGSLTSLCDGNANWATVSWGIADTGYTANGIMTIRLRMSTTSAVANGVQLGDIKLNYLSKW